MPDAPSSDGRLKQFDRIIMGIDPGTNVMGYSLLGVAAKKPVMIAMGVIELSRFEDHYMRLRRIYDRVLGLVESFLPDELAIEAPFFGKNGESTLRPGMAQGVAMATAVCSDVAHTAYWPRKIKMAITGNGAASKEQVSAMLQRILQIPDSRMADKLDATDALGAALCHFYETSKPVRQQVTSHSWKDFINKNPDRIV